LLEVSPEVSPSADPSAPPSPPPSPLTVALSQKATSYDAATNVAMVAATATAGGFVPPWQYSFAVRGGVVTTGSSETASVTVSLRNACSITTQSVTVSITDALGRTASAASTLARSLCPPPPPYPHATDKIIAGPTLTEASFVDRLRAVGSPALAEGASIYQTLVAAGVNPAFALGTFHAESHSGTRGYAVTTKNWGNILWYSWEAEYGAVPYAPGNGYTYAMYPDWLSSVRAYAALLRRYNTSGYTTVSSASAHWLGTIEGSSRHLTYLNNITGVMSILPDDAVPVMTSLSLPATSRATVAVGWSARDNLAVTAFELRTRLGSGAWSEPEPIAAPGTATVSLSRSLQLSGGPWTIAIRAGDGAGNWSPWRSATVAVDAEAPAMTGLAATAKVIRTLDGSFTVRWSARDNVGVSRYQWRLRRNADGVWSAATRTSSRSVALKPGPGSWYVSVRARDAVGNWSDWREIRVLVPVDDRRYEFSRGTVRRVSSYDYRGTLTTTNRAGARLTTSFTGTAFYLVGDAGPRLGRLRVTIDGTSQVVDTGYYRGVRASRTHHRVILYRQSLPAGTHSLTITNLGTSGRPTIAVDGLAFAR
jgi:hypothetical protein